MAWLLVYTVAVLGVSGLLVWLPASLEAPPLQAVAAVDGTLLRERWVIVRSQSGSWYLNGEPYSSSGLARHLGVVKTQPLALVPMPANGRRVAQIHQDLLWLRMHTDLPLTLGVLSPAEGS